METKVNQCGICSHGGGKYSLTLNIENAHVNMGTYCWETYSGYVINVSIFDMSVDNMYELAQKIIDVANSISSKGLDND